MVPESLKQVTKFYAVLLLPGISKVHYPRMQRGAEDCGKLCWESSGRVGKAAIIQYLNYVNSYEIIRKKQLGSVCGMPIH